MRQDVLEFNSDVEKVLENMKKVMVGKEEIATLSLVALLAEGHVLLEDVPGVGKTMLVRALAKSLDCEFQRIQFTPDLLPSDVTGVSIYNPKEMVFEFREGPIFGNVVLADEINRTSPKTQSALLEGMEENSVTADGQTLPLKQPFFVMATQNPIEYEGTYALPEAQLDRFIMKLKMGYPSNKEELEMLDRTSEGHPINDISAVMDRAELTGLQQQVKDVYVDQTVQSYIIQLTSATRNHSEVHLGVSPRGSMVLMRASKAYAFVLGRDYVVPDDVQYLAPMVMTHRLILTTDANFSGVTPVDVVNEVLERIQVPIRKGF